MEQPAYFTIFTRDGGAWYPQFGDYDREVVEQEKEDEYGDYHPDCIRILSTTCDQAAIDEAAEWLNRHDIT